MTGGDAAAEGDLEVVVVTRICREEW